MPLSPQDIQKLTTLMQQYQQQGQSSSMGAVNPLVDIQGYAHNPYRGYMAAYGGYPEQAGLGKFFKKAFNFGKTALKTGADSLLTPMGMGDLVRDSFIDRSKFASGVLGTLGKIAPMALNVAMPGTGTLLQGINSIGNSLGGPQGGPTAGGNQMGGGFGGFGMFPQQTPYQSSFGQGLFRFADGGVVEGKTPRTPVQAETYKKNREYVVMPTLHIAPVNAGESHDKMSPEEVTDYVPEGSYIASSRPKTAFTREELEKFEVAVEANKYEEGVSGDVPEVINAAGILPKGTKKILPSEYAALIAKTFPTVDEVDQFTKASNQQNLAARLPYLQALTQLGESKRDAAKKSPTTPEAFRQGGHVPKFNFGDWAGIASTALPFITSAFGRGGGFGQGGALDPMNDAMITGSFPLTSLGITNNVNAQEGALDNAMANLTGLTQQQMGFNDMGSMAGIMGSLAQETALPQLQQDFSRIQNFNTTTPQQFIRAAAAPAYDVSAQMDGLGRAGSVAALANQNAQSMQARNQAAQTAFAGDRQMQYGIANTLTQGMNQQEQYNNQLLQQEVAARNNVMSNIGSTVTNNLQNRSNILAGAYQTGTQLDLQRAALAGQIPGAIGQQMFNAAIARQSLMNVPQPGGGNIAPPQAPNRAPAPVAQLETIDYGPVSSMGVQIPGQLPTSGIPQIPTRPLGLPDFPRSGNYVTPQLPTFGIPQLPGATPPFIPVNYGGMTRYSLGN